jgi:hypothetical protein
MGRFLVWLSGANRQILESTPNDRAKYVGIGTLILLPGLMGTVSMMFALTTVLNFKPWVALPFALGWGLAIICMDRVFVVTLQRKRSWLAIPRIMLALLLGLVISTPFVLQIFRPEIEQEIVKLQNAQATQFIGSAASSKVADQIATDKATINTLQAEIASGGPGANLTGDSTLQGLDKQLSSDQASENYWYAQWQCQLYGTEQSGGKCKPGNGPLAQQSATQVAIYRARITQDQQAVTARENILKINAQSSAAKTIAQEQQQLQATQQQLQTDQNLQATETANFLARNKEDTGLLIRMKALDVTTAGNTTLEAARWLLFALFVVIDLMPVLMKVMMNWAPPSSYEKMLADEEGTQFEVAENRRAVWKHTQFKAAQTIAGSSRDRLAGLAAPLPEVKDDIIAARRRVEGEWLRAWEAGQMRRIANGEQITTGQTGVGPDEAASSMASPPPDREPRRQYPREQGRQYRREPGLTWLQDFLERFSWWREPADPPARATSARAGGTGWDGSPRSTARRRPRSASADAWPDGLFQRRVPGDTTAGETSVPPMFLREFVPQPSSPPEGPGGPDGSAPGTTQGTPYR